MPIQSELITLLAKYETATICNVIELFDVRPRTEGYMNGSIRAAFPELPPMVGVATTATFRSATPPHGGDVHANLERQLQDMALHAVPTVVVFQDLDEPPVGATFGEVMCSIYQSFRAAGLITSGGGRDLAQVRALGFPVFTLTTICSHAYSQTVDVGQPVRVGGLVVHSGDLLHGDANGVTNIPSDIAADVADVAEEFIDAERLVTQYSQAQGEKTTAEMMNRRRAMSASIAVLRDRVSRKSGDK